ncbi:MAG: cell division protein FtsH, partial [Verrucomicrobia bacterium]|nr:cell division protein FtsH [Verrucomicrobiota bacterium]
MNQEKKNEPKRPFSNSLVLIVMGVILALIVMQNYLETKVARISFNYQLEPLVNLDLIQPDDSRKTAVSGNLVTFSGRFREHLTAIGKERYKYLDLLDTEHELEFEKQQQESQLDVLRKRTEEAASLFLAITGRTLAHGGYTVVDEIFNTPDRINAIIIHEEPKKSFMPLAEISDEMQHANASNVDTLFRNFQFLVRSLRSPLLGIGSEPMKQTLRAVDTNLAKVAGDAASSGQRLAAIDQALPKVQEVCSQLNQEVDHMRLTQLRSVRDYKETLDQLTSTMQKIDENNERLAKARSTVEQVVWFFNNQELSSRALEKQDPEMFHQWFVTAKEEWQNFDMNRGAYFKAPDQPLNKVLERTFKSEELPPNYISYLLSVAPVFLILF